MNLEELDFVVSTVNDVQKLNVVAETMYDQHKDCYKTFKTTGSLPAGHLACRSAHAMMRAIRDKQRYHAIVS